jgi:hypothetical protein
MKINTAEKIESFHTVLERCLVVGAHGGKWTVEASYGQYAAKTAASCLVKPEKGDIVLVSIDEEGYCYILSILERPDHKRRHTTLSLDGQVKLEVPDGGLVVSAQNGIRFLTPEKLAVTSEELEINTLKGDVKIEGLSFLGRIFEGKIEKVKVIADTFDAIFRRAVQRFVSSYRYVEGHEEIQTGSTRLLVEGTLAMQTKNTMHTAEGHVKIDAGQIHLG